MESDNVIPTDFPYRFITDHRLKILEGGVLVPLRLSDNTLGLLVGLDEDVERLC
jgi:hypothetical protein